MDIQDTNYNGEHKCNSFPFSVQIKRVCDSDFGNTDAYDFYDDTDGKNNSK